jgi:hypothetical protein
MAVDVAQTRATSPIRSRSRLEAGIAWLQKRPRALTATVLIVLSLLLGATAILTARSGHDNVDTYATMLAVEFLGTPDTHKVEISAPGYPLVLAALSHFDPGVQAAVICHGIKVPCAGDASFASLFGIQFVVGVIALLATYLLAYRLSQDQPTALLALILTFAGQRLGAHTAAAGMMIWITAFTTLALACGVEAYLRSSIVFAAISGVMAGITIVFYPPTAVLALALAVALGTCGKSPMRGAAAGLCALAAAIAVPVVVFAALPDYSLAATGRALLLMLSERIGHQPTDFGSWVGSLLLPIPFFGGWFELLFHDDPAGQAQRSFEIFATAQAIEASTFGQYVWLARTHVFDDAAAYLAATPSLLNRGIWAGADIVALIGLFHLRRLVTFARADGRMATLLIVLTPATALLVANSLLTSNQPWSNPALPFLWAFAIAYVVGRFPATSSGAAIAHWPPLEQRRQSEG